MVQEPEASQYKRQRALYLDYVLSCIEQFIGPQDDLLLQAYRALVNTFFHDLKYDYLVDKNDCFVRDGAGHFIMVSDPLGEQMAAKVFRMHQYAAASCCSVSPDDLNWPQAGPPF